jgi:hypothetical protein
LITIIIIIIIIIIISVIEGNPMETDWKAVHHLSLSTCCVYAGAGAGMVSSVVTCPLDVVKTKLQAQGGMFHPHPTVDTYEGLLGMYG